ncbi:MAG: RtcB family protein [Microlunatus sp.]|nr:RtcB family protein [Microlunatus sp.]
MPEQLAKKLINWASVLEDATREQALATCELPFIFPHLALMPDAHLGKGATVGSVIPTDRAIIPAAVGVDIGCGMIAVRTQFTLDELPPDRQAVRSRIESVVPLSAGAYNKAVFADATAERIEKLAGAADFDLDRYAPNWPMQLGSLGSGNHFIEISVDDQDRVWLFLHSGSRGVGNKIAQHHITQAKKIMKQYWIRLPDADLAYLVEGTPEFSRYLSELRWAQAFALANREEMMDRVLLAVQEWTGTQVQRELVVNCHHNYTAEERHYGRSVWVSRKGAIDAHAGVWGLIPGSMGTRSYVVQGKGNPVSLCSAPHGAGRRLSRSAARKQFTVDDLRAAMRDIEYRDTDAFIDEIPAAYKDVDQVLADAADLVEIRYRLRQIVNVKGD